MRIHPRIRRGRFVHALLIALSAGLAHAQVATAPPVPPVPPAQADPAPPVSPVPVNPPEQAPPAPPSASPVAPVPAPQETTPPAAATNQAAELARGDPVRWYQEDATEEQRLRTLRKEIGAAYEEARVACRREAPAARAHCLKDARATYEQELAGIKSGVSVR